MDHQDRSNPTPPDSELGVAPQDRPSPADDLTAADRSATPARHTPAETCSSGEDDICSDEIAHGRQTEDPAMLDGSILGVGAGIAGLTPVESPELERRSRPVGANDCTECGGRR